MAVRKLRIRKTKSVCGFIGGHFSVKVGNLFDSYRSTIITLYNGAYDSSAVVLLIIKVIDIRCNKDPSALRSASKVKHALSSFVFLSKVAE